jgi:hypothetical protein
MPSLVLPITAHRRSGRSDLDWIFTVQTERTVAKDNTVTIGDRVWQIEKSRFRSAVEKAELWKLAKTKGGFPPVPTPPWKSLNREIPTFPLRRRVFVVRIKEKPRRLTPPKPKADRSRVNKSGRLDKLATAAAIWACRKFGHYLPIRKYEFQKNIPEQIATRNQNIEDGWLKRHRHKGVRSRRF